MDVDQLVNELIKNVLTLEIIDKEKLVAENLFEIKIEGKILGPFAAPYLKAIMEGKEIKNVMVKNLESIIWVPIYQHPFFFNSEIKRPPQTEIERREFYLLVNGKKIGPYKIEDIDFKVKSGELLFTDMISEDEGNNWIKLHELSHVDLRRHQGNELPHPPPEVVQPASIDSNVKEEIELVGDLVKAGIDITKERAKRLSDLESEQELEEKSFFQKFGNIIVLIIVLLAGFYFFGNKIKDYQASLEEERLPTSVEPLKPKSVRKARMPKAKKRLEKIVPRPPRFPVPAPEPTQMEAGFQEEYNPDTSDANDDFLEEEEKPKKPSRNRARSKPKIVDETLDEAPEEPEQ